MKVVERSSFDLAELAGLQRPVVESFMAASGQLSQELSSSTAPDSNGVRYKPF
jgi:hypothetical protein